MKALKWTILALFAIAGLVGLALWGLRQAAGLLELAAEDTTEE